MGNVQAIQAAKKAQEMMPSEIGHWVSDFKTGQRWATIPIQSDPTIVKKITFGQRDSPSETIPSFENNVIIKQLQDTTSTLVPNSFFKPTQPGEIWGPYKKTFTKSILGQNIFTPPESVDNIPLLCRCRDIQGYVRDDQGGRTLNALYALLGGTTPPACYDDNQWIQDPYGGMNFFVVLRHPDFYNYAQSQYGSMGVVAQTINRPRVTGALPAYFAAKNLGRKNVKPGNKLGSMVTIAKTFLGGKQIRSRRNPRKKNRKTRRRSRAIFLKE
jgi:hypothetical protein